MGEKFEQRHKIVTLATVSRLDALDTDGIGRQNQRVQEDVPRKEIALVVHAVIQS